MVCEARGGSVHMYDGCEVCGGSVDVCGVGVTRWVSLSPSLGSLSPPSVSNFILLLAES